MATTTLQNAAAIAAKIDELYHELRVRESAAPHLSGIPALQNQSSINRLYDDLNHLHIACIEQGVQ